MEYELNLREYWRIFKKRKWIIAASAFATALVSFVFALANRPAPVYETSSTVKIEKSSTVTGLYLEAISWSSADFLETQASIITSYPIMEKVAKELGRIDPALDSTRVRSDSTLIGKVLAIKEQVRTEREGNSNLINIFALAERPKEAQEIANTVARVFTVNHTDEANKRTLDSRRFIEEQLARVREKLSDAEEKVRVYREQEGLHALDNQTSLLLAGLTNAEAEQMKIGKRVDEIDMVLARLESAPKRALTSQDSFHLPEAPDLYNTLHAKLVNLLLERDTLLLTFTAEHPKVKEIDSQTREIATNMAAILREILASQSGRLAGIQSEITAAQQSLDALPNKRLALARLERDVQLNEKVYELLESKLQEAKIMEAAKIEEVAIVKPALEPTRPIKQPQTMVKTIMGFLVGIIIGVVYAFIYETFDTSIGAIKEVEEFVGHTVVGVIPAVEPREVREVAQEVHPGKILNELLLGRIGRLITHFMPNSPAAECFRGVRANIQFAGFENNLSVVAFTSAVPDEGKSTTVINTAIAFAQANNRVLLVEADLRKPIASRWFGVQETPGLTEILLESFHWREVIRNVTDFMLGEMEVEEVMFTQGLDNLHLIPGGTEPSNPAELLASDRLMDFLEEARQEYDVVLIDLPPILPAAETSIIASKVDGVVLIYRAGKTARGALGLARDQLKNARARIVGVVLNGLKAEHTYELGGFGYQRYGYNRHPEDRRFSLRRLLRRGLRHIMETIAGSRSFPSKEEAGENQSPMPKWLKTVVLLAGALLLAAGFLVLRGK